VQDMDILKSKLIERAKDLGFPLVGITDARPFDLWAEALNKRKKTAGDVTKTTGGITAFPSHLMADAKAVVVAVRPYIPYPDQFPQGIGAYSAHYIEYPRGRKAIGELAKVIVKQGYDAISEPPLPAKAAACRAGVGTLGKNGLIYTAEYGSWVTLHIILTNAPFTSDSQLKQTSLCGDCNQCIQACPTQAIGNDGDVLPQRCLRWYMLSAEIIPVDVREKLGTRLLGCDICQKVCPRNNKRTCQVQLPGCDDTRHFDIYSMLKALVENDRGAIQGIASLIGRNYARSQRLLSGFIVAAGNMGQQKFIPLLIKTLRHPHPPIRAHSAWALGKIGGIDSKDALLNALELEENQRVIEEIERAMSEMKDNNA